MQRPTTTTNRLHFSDLDPIRFEDLCLCIVSRLEKWKELAHFGRKGSDGGVDILAVKETAPNEKWFIQCKRYTSITKADFKKIVDRIAETQSLPDKLLVIVACDVSKTLYEYLKSYSKLKGIVETELWSASVLEAKLYEGYKDLLFVYFGLRIEAKTQSNIAKIKQSSRMEKKIRKELIDHKYLQQKNDSKYFLFRPWDRFISQTVIIRSVDDTSYPGVDETEPNQISSWFQIFLYNTYYNGIEVCINLHVGADIIMDENGNWEAVSYFDKRKSSSKYKLIKGKCIGRIPYSSIVELKVDGDEYKDVPHLFCTFNVNGAPYEEIYYKTKGDPDKDIPDWDFDKEKQTKFPSE